MTIECPACSARGKIDLNGIPEDGRKVICPRCGKHFDLPGERPKEETIPPLQRIVCPQCKCEQPKTETCAICGLEITKLIQARVKKQEIERLEFVKLRTEAREVNAWYGNLFDRRLASLLTRVLSLLVLLLLFMTCSMNSAKRNRFYAENTAEMRKAAEGGVDKRSAGKKDDIFREKFATVVEGMIANTEACLSQNYDYKSSWNHGSQPCFLSPSLTDNLGRINRQRHEAETAFYGLPTPSKRYFACYSKSKELSHLNKQVCGMANAYGSYIPDFNDRLSNFNFEFSRIKGALNECKERLY